MRYVIAVVGILIITLPGLAAEQADAKRAGEIYPYMCSGPLEGAIVTDKPEGAVASYGGVAVSQADLDKALQDAPEFIKTQLSQYPIYVLEQQIVRGLLVKEAKDWAARNDKSINVDETELMGTYLASSVPEAEVTEDEIRAFYEENKAMFHGAGFDQVRSHIMSYLKNEKRSTAQHELINSVWKRHRIEISDAWLKSAAAKWAENPVETARTSGKPSFIAFSTVGCCDTVGPIVQKLKSDNGDALNTVFVNLANEQVLANLYRIRSSPVLFIFDKDGKEIMRQHGNLTAEQIQARLDIIGVE